MILLTVLLSAVLFGFNPTFCLGNNEPERRQSVPEATKGTDGDKTDDEFESYWASFVTALQSADTETLGKLVYSGALSFDLSYDDPKVSYEKLETAAYCEGLKEYLNLFSHSKLHGSYYETAFDTNWQPLDCVFRCIMVEKMDTTRPLFKSAIHPLVPEKDIIKKFKFPKQSPVYIVEVSTEILATEYCQQNIQGYPETQLEMFFAKVGSEFKLVAVTYTAPE